MGKAKKNKKDILKEQEIFEEQEGELNDFVDDNGEIIEEELCEETSCENIKEAEKNYKNKQEEKCQDKLIKLKADFENFKSRVEREKNDMIFFLKQDIFQKILPRLDDIERIINNTPEEEKNNSIYEAIIVLQKKLVSDLEKLGVSSFKSIGEEVSPDLHDVMTTVPGKKQGIIIDEFEKGYKLNDRVLRHAKVVVGAG